MVTRRSRREPLQQIVGSTSFCGFEIAVNRHVLVPRPETELLAEEGWNFLNQVLQRGLQSPSGLDFGTGSGCLAIALAAKCPGARLCAVELSQEALVLAQDSARKNGVAERIEFFHGDGFTALPPERNAFDLVVSNPPYIPSAEIACLQPEVRDFEPRSALDGGPDGLDYFRRLAREAAAFLNPGGKLMLEFGDGQSKGLQALFEKENWIVETLRDDYNQRPRILIAHHGKPTH
jgi:release factor glutamine methyltransferase